ncbi:hypothetical protein ABHM93_05190 [Micromonospora provocatoris]|uniref:hypothetical protein n=1 Tax=Bacillati TaxID=1783272 RepID=UPI001935454C|nr:hypothetical protein JNUCC52_13835 [Lysinibacillus sp. JNUCC-52]
MQTESTISSYSSVSYVWSIEGIELLKVTGNGIIAGTNKSELELLEALWSFLSSGRNRLALSR